ncbi:MAG: hypothetical protein JNK48_03490 [Bryobacterales bacterium]|nr:hypothetical protein [Bryobacterales bacterium]
MLTIRQAQFEAFRRNIDRIQLDRLIPQLQEEFPGRFDSPDSAHAFASTVMHKAEASNIESYGAILELARLMVRFGPNLEQYLDPAWGAAILSHKALPGDLKIDFLRRRLEPRIPAEDRQPDQQDGQEEG